MGTKLKELVEPKEITIQDLQGKILAVDSYNILYQFLSSIRQRDGQLLMDSKGRVTSHLTGLFSRTVKLMQYGLKLAFVFDGKPPQLKQQERDRRMEAKQGAMREYEAAKEREDLPAMKKFASRTSILNKEMVEEAKRLVDALGLPVLQAPSEGEAQAAALVITGKAYGAITQDFDSLLFGVPRFVRNLTVSERRKLPGRQLYETVKPELITLQDSLQNLGVSKRQLIAIGMLIGTDYNPNGIKGLGPKKALKLVKQYGEDFDALFKAAEWGQYCRASWSEVMDLFTHPLVNDSLELNWGIVDVDKVHQLLVEEHDFSADRVEKTLSGLKEATKQRNQKGLGEFF